MYYQTHSAVLLLLFNRPDTTCLVFEAIKQAAPPRLYIAADGARTDRDNEAELCREAIAITKNIDWPCEVSTLFRTTNLGCKEAVSSAIDWFFEHEEEGIILEDDCLPANHLFSIFLTQCWSDTGSIPASGILVAATCNRVKNGAMPATTTLT